MSDTVIEGATSAVGIPFTCKFNYVNQLVNDEIEFLFMPFYLYLIVQYQFWINMSFYVPEVKFLAQVHKSWWLKFVSVFEGDSYFAIAMVEFWEIWGLEFMVCDILMWKYWVFHLITLGLPSFEQIDSDTNPMPEDNWDFTFT